MARVEFPPVVRMRGRAIMPRRDMLAIVLSDGRRHRTFFANEPTQLASRGDSEGYHRAPDR